MKTIFFLTIKTTNKNTIQNSIFFSTRKEAETYKQKHNIKFLIQELKLGVENPLDYVGSDCYSK